MLIIQVFNKYLSEAVQQLAFDNGYGWGGHDKTIKNYHDEHGNETVYFIKPRGQCITYEHVRHANNTYPTTPILSAKTEWDKIEEFLNKPKPITVKLNNQYTAIVNKETGKVKVGCSEFEFERIEELYNAIKK